MKIINIKSKRSLGIIVIITFILTVGIFSTAFAMQHYYKLDFSTGLVTANKLNVRSGPGLQYGVIATVKQNEYIRVFAGVGEWYIVQVEGDYVGAVNRKYIKPIYSNNSNTAKLNNQLGDNDNFNMNEDEKEILNLINIQRKDKGLSELKEDNEVQRVARIKAQDMIDNNYFSHVSPIYGSPFDMLKSFKISYNSAGENIAGNSNNKDAVTSWMNSSGHKANILNSNFNYTGIGVVNSSKYGKIYVQIFIGK